MSYQLERPVAKMVTQWLGSAEPMRDMKSLFTVTFLKTAKEKKFLFQEQCEGITQAVAPHSLVWVFVLFCSFY